MSSKIKKNYAQKVRELKLFPLKVGVLSCTSYQNHLKIQDTFQKLLDVPNYITVCGGGANKGGDSYIKKLAIDLKFPFLEYNPPHTERNAHSAFGAFYYGKPYSFKACVARYYKLFEACDKLIIFMDKSSQDKELKAALTQISNKKFDIPHLIMD